MNSTVTTSRISVEESLAKMLSKVGEKGGETFPILDHIWDIFGTKGIRTVFLTIGSSKVALPDLEIAENLGCPLNIVALNEAEKGLWTEVSGVLKERKREATANPFSAGAESKWILPKNVRISDTLPWWENGTIDISGLVIKTQKFSDYMQGISSTMKIKDNLTRIDILKIDTAFSAPGLERSILAAVLNAGYRPAIILVRWTSMPDTELSATIAAGHLQNSGYALLGKEENKFLYYFSDEDLYQICSWEGVTTSNPITTEILAAAKKTINLKASDSTLSETANKSAL